MKNEKASLTLCVGVFRWLFATAVHFHRDILKLDVTNAFLHAEVKYEKYIMTPPGFDEHGENMVGKLQKSLYGLVTSPLA